MIETIVILEDPPLVSRPFPRHAIKSDSFKVYFYDREATDQQICYASLFLLTKCC